MKILNLVYPDKSDITYKVSKFPDGQQNIVINAYLIETDGIDEWITQFNKKQQFLIKSHLNDFRDLELIICAVASLRELGVEDIHLYTPYIMGARSDRKFEEGGNNYLKDVICPIINSLNFKTVTCIDPHSDVLEACIKGFKKESNLDLVKFALNKLRIPTPINDVKNYVLISPDAGATKKIFKLAEQIHYKGDILTCSKDRDVDGNLTSTVVPLVDEQGRWGNYANRDFIIIDDICDGGATFINIAKELHRCRDIANIGKIYLIVTHGIFSKGFEELGKYFDGIYCTNSYSDVAELTTEAINKPVPTKVKQLNVF